MADPDRESSETARVVRAVPVTPSAGTEKPEGLAFDVDKGADLSGVPVGDQMPANGEADRTDQVVQESGRGVGLAVPGDSGQNAEKSVNGEAAER